MEQPQFEMPDIPEAPPIEATQIAVDRTQVMAPPAGATQTLAPVQCPICKQHNPPGDNYCVECGFLLTSAAPSEEVAPATLPALHDDQSGRDYWLKQGENSIGRENCDILLPHGSVSRRHATLTLADDGIWVEDAGSTNGTKVGSERIPAGEKRAVTPGTVLEFGSVQLKLTEPDGFVATPAITTETAEPAATEDPVLADPVLDDPTVAASLPPVSVEVALVTTTDATATTYKMKPGDNSIGRRPENSIVIPNPYVSGKHALMTIQGDEVYISDIGSTNGTSVNGNAVEPNVRVKLSNGDTVNFGQAGFKVDITPIEAPAEEESEPEPEE